MDEQRAEEGGLEAVAVVPAVMVERAAEVGREAAAAWMGALEASCAEEALS